MLSKKIHEVEMIINSMKSNLQDARRGWGQGEDSFTQTRNYQKPLLKILTSVNLNHLCRSISES